jgi:BirA family biotin operon repressor/biotin-[acetyl-CoA-carboxylase] ligase
VPGFNVEHFQQVLRTRSIGRLCHYLPVIASTNATARLLGRQGRAEGSIVLADAQTAGRGQAGKVWISPPERNVYVSILLRPAIAPAQAPLISLMAAVALVDTLRQEGAAGGIKWPNDVLLQQRKVAGILTEMEISRDAVHFVVVGIGINVNMTQTELERDLGPIALSATSMAVALGREICREGLLAALMESLERWYDRFRAEGILALHDAWEARSLMRGRRVSARTPEASWKGMAEGIDQAGRLLLRREEGGLLALTSAEVRFLDCAMLGCAG